MVSEMKVHFSRISEATQDFAAASCRITIVAVATCGLGMFFGGICYIFYKQAQFNVRFQSACSCCYPCDPLQKFKEEQLNEISQILSSYTRQWADRGIQFTLKQEIIGMTRGKHRRPIYGNYVRFSSLACVCLLCLVSFEPALSSSLTFA